MSNSLFSLIVQGHTPLIVNMLLIALFTSESSNLVFYKLSSKGSLICFQAYEISCLLVKNKLGVLKSALRDLRSKLESSKNGNRIQEVFSKVLYENIHLCKRHCLKTHAGRMNSRVQTNQVVLRNIENY